jgi:hypothetical protein
MDVGVGKTIEAAMIVRELLDTGRVRSWPPAGASGFNGTN